jgi:CPA2 family monovalent cation:H+ antiporter-2
MHHSQDLISTIAIGFSLALAFGLIAHKLKLPPLVGYLLAGVMVGPFTPGYVADSGLAPQLAEIGVMLLMFGVGIHFSIEDLVSVWKIAVPGAIGQVVLTIAAALAVTTFWGWPVGYGIVFGLALSVASTVVVLKSLEALGVIDQRVGRITVGWLVVEDLIMVVALVLLPAFADVLGGESTSNGPLWRVLTETGLKLAAFLVIMFVGGRRIVPWLLRVIERTGSREIFVLGVLAVSIGIAYASSELFGVSLALGAFLAGMVVNESEFSHRAAEEALPLREAFAVLFFVSVGMLVDPHIFIDEIDKVLLTVALIVAVKTAAVLSLMRILDPKMEGGLVVGLGLAQIGEFSFILADLGLSLHILSEEARALLLAGALVSITVNPLLLRLVQRQVNQLTEAPAAPQVAT